MQWRRTRLSCSLVVGAVRSKGVEFDVQGTLLPGWNVTLAYTNMDARITKTNPGPDQTGTLGQRIPGVPRNLGSFTTSYEFQDDSPLKGLKIGGGVDYHGSQPYSAQPNSQQIWRAPVSLAIGLRHRESLYRL